MRQGVYVLGILFGILSALVLKSAFRGRPVPFVMELPNYRLPSLKSVALLLWDKAKDFIERAFTVIFLATIVIWFLQSFDARLNVVTSSEQSLLAIIGRWLAPIFAPLGFGDWRCATALITGFIAKESVVSTLQILLGTSAVSSSLLLPIYLPSGKRFIAIPEIHSFTDRLSDCFSLHAIPGKYIISACS